MLEHVPSPGRLLVGPVAVALALSACAKKPRADETEVFQVALPGRFTAPHRREYVAEVQALRRAEVRARIKGQIESVAIDEGQSVKAGQLLFSISARELQQERRRAAAAVASATAELQAAGIERTNTRMLLDKAVVSKAEMAVIDAKAQLLAAKLEEARAQEGQAVVSLGYSEVRAPFPGVVNRVPKKMGSVVAEGDLLTTLTDTSEVLVYFRVSEQEHLEYTSPNGRGRSREVSFKLANGELLPATGVLDAAENEFDRNTGTIALRARFPNPQGTLKHGGSGKVLVSTMLRDALTIPQKSTFEVQDHLYVYIIDGDGKARARRIVPRIRLEDAFVVESGIKPDERFILEGVQKVEEGARVVVRTEEPPRSGTPL